MNGGCVEIADNLPGVVAVRDSKRPEGGAHVVGRERVRRVPGRCAERPVRLRGQLGRDRVKS